MVEPVSDTVEAGLAHPYIDLRTRWLVMPGGKTVFTGEERQGMRWPPCPCCGASIGVAKIDVTC